MLTSTNEERGRLAAQRRGRVVDDEVGAGQPDVPIVLAAVGKGAAWHLARR